MTLAGDWSTEPTEYDVQRLVDEIRACTDDPVLLNDLFLRANAICNATRNPRLADERAERFANAF
jgi:hypothetical protein